ncbi:thioredoxin domain-containing protein [Leuconostoc citreum]|uniref:thioredoxin domain-containing protein n=1 Tax=Leuconostoc citreum TaxID=33964 RepID=UPI000BFEF352|nr:thioredoxin domain-containing protein [Leuconostoc citreum]
MTKGNKKTRIKALIVMIIVSIIVLISGLFYQKYSLNGYPDTKNFSQKINQLDATNKQKTVLIFHRPGCSDCKSVRELVKQTIKTNHTRINYIVINVNNNQAKTFMIKYGVTAVPTIIYLEGNQVIDSTTSTHAKDVKRVMTGE